MKTTEIKRPVVHPHDAVLGKAGECVLGALDGHMREGCVGIEAELVDADGDGTLTVTVLVEASTLRQSNP